MTSFLTNVLVTAGKLEKVNLNEKFARIQEEIISLKYSVKDLMDNNYVEFTPKLTEDQKVVQKTQKLIEELDILQKEIDDQVKIELSGSTKELQALTQALKESNTSLQLSNKLLTLNECIKSIKKYIQEKRYVDVAKTLNNMQSILNDPKNNLSELDIFAALEEEYCKLFTSFLNDGTDLLQKKICWTGTASKDLGTITLSVKGELKDLQDLICGLHCIDNFLNHLHKFATTLMDFVISPIINDETSVYVVDERIFTVEILRRKKIPSYNYVLYNLELLFKFIHQHFNLTIGDNEETFLQQLQSYLLEPFKESLTVDCISRIIPRSNEDLKNFTPVIDAINEFQDILVQIGFITPEQLFLSEYTKNIDNLFIERICQDLLIKARTIMKKDLHDSVKYEPQEPLEFSVDAYESIELNIDRRLSDTTFQLPECQISKSAKETLDLARSILEEACRSSDACAVRLFYTCRIVFEMYSGLVPEHHKRFLETLPQQVALFHNNCMYLAHNLFTLAHEYRDKLPKCLQELNVTFVDQTLVLRNVGSQCFLEHMRYQRNIIFDILKESGLSVLGQTDNLDHSTERALRQCIRQLELLKTVWLDVLPINIYCKAVGCIANSMIDDLIIRVVSVEDIPADVATELKIIFEMVVKRAPIIFPDPKNIYQHVRRWEKFLELIKILGASLKEIEMRWGGGKGPLARVFSASHVKQLIRALFQNTERRSNLLACIK